MIRRCFDLVSAPTGTFYVALSLQVFQWECHNKKLNKWVLCLSSVFQLLAMGSFFQKPGDVVTSISTTISMACWPNEDAEHAGDRQNVTFFLHLLLQNIEPYCRTWALTVLLLPSWPDHMPASKFDLKQVTDMCCREKIWSRKWHWWAFWCFSLLLTCAPDWLTNCCHLKCTWT